MKIFKAIAYTSIIVWLLIGLLVEASIVYGTTYFIVNIIMGFVFMAIAYFLYVKAKNNVAMLQMQTDNSHKKTQKQFFRVELLFFILSLLVGLLLLSGVTSRVFFEKMPIFG